MSDLKLVKAMDRLSANGQLAYTETQLFYAVSGKKTAGTRLLTRLKRGPRVPKHQVPTMDRSTFVSQIEKWTGSAAQMRGRYLSPTLLPAAPNRQLPTGPVPPEIAVHGFDRALVVDSAEVAITLVANNFHIDNRCAVISIDGYPEAFLGSLLELLNRNPQLVVAVAHGAKIESMDLALRLRAWFPDPRIRLVEVGLRPAQVVSGGLYATTAPRRDSPDPLVAGNPALSRLSDAERAWLAWGLETSLESLGPRRLMRVLSQVFAHLSQAEEQALGRTGDASHDNSYYDDGHVGNLGHAGNPVYPGVIFLDSSPDAGKALGHGTDEGEDAFASFDRDGLDRTGFDGADFDGDG